MLGSLRGVCNQNRTKHVDCGLLDWNVGWTWWWRWYVPPKCWWSPTRLHGVTNLKTTINIFTDVSTSQITEFKRFYMCKSLQNEITGKANFNSTGSSINRSKISREKVRWHVYLWSQNTSSENGSSGAVYRNWTGKFLCPTGILNINMLNTKMILLEREEVIIWVFELRPKLSKYSVYHTIHLTTLQLLRKKAAQHRKTQQWLKLDSNPWS